MTAAPFRFDELPRRLLLLKHDEEVVRSLEEVVDEEKAKAWDQGRDAGWSAASGNTPDPVNPYRALDVPGSCGCPVIACPHGTCPGCRRWTLIGHGPLCSDCAPTQAVTP